MLTHVDVFVGTAMVMLAVSLLVTIFTQAVSLVLELRAGQLRKGLAELFQTLGITAEGTQLAQTILTHPLLTNGVWKKLAPAISKTDLINLLQSDATLLAVDQAVRTALATKTKEVERWFDATMSRVSHRFATWTRLITVIGAVLAAFLLQLDTFGLVKRLYSDSDLRAKMAGAATAVVTQGQEVLATPTVFLDVARKVASESGGKLPPPQGPFPSRVEAEAWIRTAAPAADAGEMVAKYQAALQEALAPAFKRWLGKAAEINDTLDSGGIRLVPDPYRPFSYPSIWAFLGVLTSAALLSLGAPFWFNALKTVSNLRPAIAAAVQVRDQEGAEKKT